jgi:hypothetical protein
MLFMQAQPHLLKRRIWRNVIMKKLKVESRRCEWRGYRICLLRSHGWLSRIEDLGMLRIKIKRTI